MGWFTKNKKPKEDNSERESYKTAKERAWQDVNESKKFVIQGGKVQCPFCSVPVGDIIVTSNTISLQGKYYATTADCNGKVNFDFKGVCNHPSQQKPNLPPPPCKMVISLGKWKKFSDMFINNDEALLVQSTIPCMISGQDIRIINSGQIEVISEIEPRETKNPRVTKMYWMDEEEEIKIKDIYSGQTGILYVFTKDFDPETPISIPLQNKDTGEEYTLEGIVDENGLAKIKWEYKNENN